MGRPATFAGLFARKPGSAEFRISETLRFLGFWVFGLVRLSPERTAYSYSAHMRVFSSAGSKTRSTGSTLLAPAGFRSVLV
jgi:hypothetical protein